MVVMSEILEHIDEIAERAELTRNEVLFFLNSLLGYIIVVDEDIYMDRVLEAYEICKSFDEKDTPFIALALKLGAPIWSNDKDLKEKQKAVRVVTTLEISTVLKEGSGSQ